jgi:hypothetical protein
LKAFFTSTPSQQCNTTQNTTTMTTNAMTINMDDANLPTEGPAWEAMLVHVLENAPSEILYEAVDGEWVKDNFDISDIYDDEEIMEYAGTLQYDTINDYIWGRVKDICREENLPDHFCPVAITNELASALKLKKENEEMREKLGKISKAGGVTYTDFLSAECCKLAKENEKITEDHQKLKLQTNEQADIISRQNEEIAKLKEMVDGWVKSYLEHLDQIQKEN